MDSKELEYKIKILIGFVIEETSKKNFNNAHRFDHIHRVYDICFLIVDKGNYKIHKEVLGISALLHDVGYTNNIKYHEKKSAMKAKEILEELKFPKRLTNKIIHCILAHRYNSQSKIKPETIEAKILFDADKLDVLGAIGLARLFIYKPGRMVYDIRDPFGERRPLNEKYCIDHMLIKAYNIKEKLFTPEAKGMAEDRENFLRFYEKQLRRELNGET